MNEIVIKPVYPELNFQAAESLNTLRGNIQMSGYKNKVIAFISSNPNEGKSTLSIMTAHALAGLHKRVVFLDCDIRNTHIKQQYQITDKTIGLTEYLCGQCSMEEIIYPTDESSMFMIFAGKTAPNPSELLSEDLFEQLLETLRKYFDYVIVDTPPINVVIDPVLLALKCDSAILVVKGFVTDRKDMMHTKKTLENAKVKILGVVINDVDRKKSAYGKYGKYGYGKYGKKYGYGYGTRIEKEKTTNEE